HRPEKFTQPLSRVLIEVYEDEPVPYIAVHRAQTVLGFVEVEELRLLPHERQGAIGVVTPAVVLADELPTHSFGFLVRKVVPHQLVTAVAADVVEGPNHLVFALDHDDRHVGGLNLFGEVAADAGQLLDTANIEPGAFEDRLTFELVELR